jgi:hypothetical protein
LILIACDDARMQWKIGDLAWVQAGPFAGFHGKIVELDPAGTARVNLWIFRRPTPAELQIDHLGSSSPDAGATGVREPRRPPSPRGSGPIASPLPEELATPVAGCYQLHYQYQF